MHLPLSDTVKNGEGQSPKMEYIVAQERSEREARTSVVVKIKIFCVKSKCILYIYPRREQLRSARARSSSAGMRATGEFCIAEYEE